MLTLGQEVTGLTSLLVLCLLLHPMIFPASLKFEISFQRKHRGVVLLKVIVTADLRVLKLIQHFLSVFANRSQNILHELMSVSENLLGDFLNISLYSKQVSLDASPIKDGEAPTVTQGRSWLLDSRIIQEEDFQVEFQLSYQVLEDVIRNFQGSCLIYFRDRNLWLFQIWLRWTCRRRGRLQYVLLFDFLNHLN